MQFMLQESYSSSTWSRQKKYGPRFQDQQQDLLHNIERDNYNRF